jgi:hypothetical protein
VNDGYVYLCDIGDPHPDGGWGDYYLNWLVLYSCYVVYPPIEKPNNWWQPWIDNKYCGKPYPVLNGLHIVNGFLTPAYVSPAVNVSPQYALRIRNGPGQVLMEWINCVWLFSYCQTTSYDKACSVFYASCQNDTLASYAPDPPAAGDVFTCWYF